jgi:hypothetical protein
MTSGLEGSEQETIASRDISIRTMLLVFIEVWAVLLCVYWALNVALLGGSEVSGEPRNEAFAAQAQNSLRRG